METTRSLGYPFPVIASRAAAVAVGAAFLASSATADIASVVGMEILTGEVSFLDGATESSSAIRIFREGTHVLSGDIYVNAVGPGTHTFAPPPVTIGAGTLVNSYLVHFDPAGGVVGLTGSVTFDPGEIIIGIMTHTPLLDASDSIVGSSDAIYPTGMLTFRAFESLPGVDTCTIAADLNSVMFSLIAELGMDQARIITAPIPGPSALAGLVLGLVAQRRRRRAN